MSATRLLLLEALLAVGINNQALGQVIRRELDALRQLVTIITGDIAPEAEQAAATLSRKQFQQVSRYTGQPVDFEATLGATSTQRQAISTGMVANATSWIDGLQSRLNSEIANLRNAGESTEAAADRLLATTIADGRASEWRLAGTTMAISTQRDLWQAANGIVGAVRQAGQRQTGQVWKKQAIAAIDERTTDCCLRVHGQIRGLDEPFVLTGTPRYADKQQHAPFHWHCRTAESLWIAEFETVGITTDEMRSAARAEIEARQRTGRRVEIHPAHATSRR